MKHFTQTTANGLHTPPCGSSQSKSTRFSLITLLLALLTLGSTSAWGAFTQGATYYVDLRTVDFYKDGAVLKVNFYDGGNYHGDINRATLTETSVSHIYSFTIPNITTDNFKIVRLDPNNLNNRWNQTVKMYENAAGDNNCINLTSWPSGDVPCSWTTYDPGSAPTPSGVTYDGSEIFYFHKKGGSLDWGTIWDNNCALYLQFSNANESSTARSSKIGYFWDADGTGGDVLATRVPAGTWSKVKILRTNNNNRNEVWNQSNYVNLEEGKDYLNNSNTMAVYSPRTFHFYISGSTTLANTGSDFNAWNGNGTAHSGSMTKLLNAGTYKFKLNPTGTVDWRSEFNMDDVDQSNSNVTLYDGNNKEIWFDLATQSEVTIACDGSKVTVNATPSAPEPLSGDYYVFGAGGTNWVTDWTRNVEANKMTIVDGVATKTFYNVSGQGLEFKIHKGETEYNNSLLLEEVGENNSHLIKQVWKNGTNIDFSISDINVTHKADVTVHFDGEHIWLTAVPHPETVAGSDWYIMGSGNVGTEHNLEWGKDTQKGRGNEHKMTVQDGVATITYYNVPNNSISYKIFRGSDNYEINDFYYDASASSGIICTDQDGNDNINVSLNNQNICIHWDGTKIWTTEAAAPITTYTVTIHPNNGAANFTMDVADGGTIASISASYGLGTATWYTDEGCTEGNEFTLNSTAVTDDMDLYAKWGISKNNEDDYYIVSCLQTASNAGESGNWSNTLSRKMTYDADSRTCSFTFIAPAGKYPFEIIMNQSWSHKINEGNYSSMFDNSKSNVTLSESHGHLLFELSEPKQVTVSYDGKVWVNVTDYAFDNSKEWRIKTSWDTGEGVWRYNTIMTNNGTTNATAILRNVSGTQSFLISTKTTDEDALPVVGNETFNALYVDMSNPSSGLTWNTSSVRRDGSDDFNSTTPQADGNYWRNCKFTLAEQSDIRITFDGGKIRCDILPKYTVSFDSKGGSEVASQSVFEGAQASVPSAPTKAGYEFVKWQLSGVDYSFSSAVTGNITLDAVWDAKTLTGISLDQTNIVMVLGGDAVTITPSYAPADLIPAQQPTYEWSVAPAGVVEVSNAGVVSVVAGGSATITCTAQGTDKSADCVVTVKDCNTVPTDIFAYTLGSDPTGDAAGSAVMNGLFNEADNTEEETVKRAKISLKDNDGNNLAALVDDNGKVKADNSVDDGSEYWYMIPAGTKAGYDLFYLKNAETNAYIYADQSTDYGQNGEWKYYAARTTETLNDADNFKWLKWINEGQGDKRYIIASAINFDANSNNGNIRGLYRTNVGAETWLDPYIKVGKQANNGYNHARNGMVPTMVEATVDNPAYMHSPVSGYYRFATGASVVATLNRAIKVNDVIRLEVKNPSKAAVSATVTIGSQVANINLAADATSTETITVTDGSRPTSITIASDDVNFMLKSVAVNREMPNPGRNPNLAWGATPSAAHQVAAGDISDYIATRSGAGLITYTSSDESIATVAADGTVHPIAEGTVTITATLEQDGCYNGGTINYSLTLNDLPKPTITITANDEMPQGSYQTVTVAQNGDGALTFEITSGTGATLTNNGDGTYLLALAGNATDIVLTASTERTESYAQFSVTKNISVQQCYVDGHVIYEYELTGHDDVADIAATGGTYSQNNIGSEGTADNPATVELIRIKFQNDQNRIMVDPAGDNIKFVTSDPGNNTDKWYKIPAGTNAYNNALYYLKNQGSGKYLYCDIAAGYLWTANGGWSFYRPRTGESLPASSVVSGNTRDAYKWFWYPHSGTEQNNLHLTVNQGYANSYATRHVINDEYSAGGSDQINDPYIRCGKGTDQGHSGLRVVNEVLNASAANPDYFYSVENDNHTYYILNGGTVTVSRASAFKAGDVITLNVFNRGDAAGNTIKVANNTIVTNVNGAAALEYTVTAGDGIQGQNNFVITPLYEFICLNSISIFRPKDEEEFINPTLTWDANLSTQQIIDRNASESSMQHAASFVAPVNASVVYSVAPAAKATVNEEGLVTLTAEAINKDVVTVTATLPAIGCYNEATTSYEIYVKDLAEPTLSASFSDGLKQGYAATLTVETNSDAEPVLSAATGFTYGDAEQAGNVYTYPIVIGGIAESVSVYVTLAQTLDFLAKEADASSDAIEESNLQDLYNNTPADGTLELESDYDGQELIINKAITINGNGHSIGNLTVQTEGDLTLSGALTVNNFSIYAKAGNTTTPAASGQVRNANNLTANGNAYFYYTVDPSGHVQYGWYDFTVPFPVDVMTGIKGIQESVLKENFINETDYAIMEFLGDNKAEGKYAYKKFRGVMQPNKLYSITLDDEYNYNTVRFQKTNSGALVADESMALPGHEGAEATKNNWNGVGNGTLHHVNIGGVSAPTIQVYQSGDKSFLPVPISDHSLAIGTAFMIQGTETMVFSQANHALLAPSREANTQPMTVQIAREEQPFSDQLFIGADELAGQGYTQGVDVAKAGDLGSAKVAQIWVNAYNSKLCAHEAQLINGRAKYELSLYAPANGTYTLTGMNIPDGYTLYLTQNGNKIWDMSDRYTIDLNKGTTTEYGLLLVERYNAPTGIENGEWTNGEAQKVLRNGVLYIIRNGEVFNAQGAVMK